MTDKIRRFSPSRTINYYKWNRYTAIANYTYYWDRFNIKTTYALEKQNSGIVDVSEYEGMDSGGWPGSSGFLGVDVYCDPDDGEIMLTGRVTQSATLEIFERYYRSRPWWTYNVWNTSGLSWIYYITSYENWIISYDQYVPVGTDSKGDSNGTVSSPYSNTYPSNGKSGNYWYVYTGGSITSYSRGTYIDQIMSMNQIQYPDNGRHTDGYWYVKVA